MDNHHSQHAEVLRELATLDPLDDRAFKILLSDDDIFTALAEAIRGENLDTESIVDINGEIAVTVKGKVIRLDALRATNEEYVNIEGQIDPVSFPYKRHLYYATVIYAMSLQKSEPYQDLKPVTSIVVYKKKPDARLMETAQMSGNLVKTETERSQLTLIAINTEKWQDAPTEELRGYLATLHHGIMHKENQSNFAGVDPNSQAFGNFQRAVKLACAQTKYQEFLERGESNMASKFMSFLSDEDRAEAKAEGVSLSVEIIRLLKDGVPMQEIAQRLNVAPATVEELSIVLS